MPLVRPKELSFCLESSKDLLSGLGVPYTVFHPLTVLPEDLLHLNCSELAIADMTAPEIVCGARDLSFHKEVFL